MSNKMKSMRAMLFLLFVAIGVNLSAQTIALSGNVKDTTGEPIIGASILEKGTTNGTITDFDGNFNLKVGSNATVVVSYIGMKPQEISVKGKTRLDVTLQDDAQALEEVVVIGYGTVAKKDLTGSVASVNAKQLEAVPVSSAVEAMTGKLPGVSITTTEGSPDADVKIRVRGGGSLSQDNSPLYIVDGFPVASISDIAPTEIQSIDILKDASSTAIYGARGANGVIIVTTKSGSEGKTQVSFGASYGIKKVTKMTETLSPYEYAMYQYELGSTDYGLYNDLDIWKSVKGTDYQDEIFGRTGNQTQYNVNVSGGSKSLKYSVSYAHNDEESIMLGSGYNKDNINAKLKSELNKWLTLDFNARLSYQKVDGLSSGADTNESNAANSIVANSVRFRPITPLTNSDDDDESSSNTEYSPLDRINATYKQTRKLSQYYNAALNWTPIKGLVFRTEFGYGWKHNDTDQAWESKATNNSKYGGSGMPQAVLIRENNRNWRNANTVTYSNDKLFGGRDRLNVLLGHEMTSDQTKSITNASINFNSSMSISEVLANMGAGEALPTTSRIGAKDNMLSFFGRVNYTMMDKYLLTLTLRADGSSKFASDNRWGYFPSAAFAWRMSDEAFMENTQDWLSNLKLRLSYGTAGNNRISSGLIYSTYTMSGATDRAPYFDENLTTMIMRADNISNPDLKWETTITRNFGIDYGFFNNRLSGAIDLYWNTTKDLLMKTEVPFNSGYRYQMQNFGKTSNKGVEFSVTAVLVDTKNFGLDFNANISYNRSRIDELKQENPWQSSNWAGSTIQKYEDFKVEEGGRLGEVWGYKTNGFYTVYDETTNPNGELIPSGSSWKLRPGIADKSSTITGGNIYPGGLKVEVDEAGNPIKQKLGNTIAPWYGGFGLNARYKNFDFGAFFNYSFGHQIINGTKLATSFYSDTKNGYNINNDFALGKRYTWVDPETGLNLARPTSSTIAAYGGMENIGNRLNELNKNAQMFSPVSATKMHIIDYAVEDASFLRVSNVTIGYTLPKFLVQKAYMQNVRFYLTGYNLFCFTSYSGADPEVDTSSKRNAMTPGVDYAAYPKSRSFVAGVNVTF